ncbi:hypothetical protein [Urbifossiella limnaea]|uniref:Uncharacterized protein n=1 Tax=Urbifossiella limnaea TaxID=2528023 RepID=A0A517XZA0_9BACT|nr:hypothetical protein [Urbifossiella limnaea]QDU22836.1 hypothetical protein ETAA1_48240 [Urbifossiella limnaea]
MTRIDVCASDDHDAIDRLQAVLGELGWVADDNWHDSPLGLGLTRFRRGGDELTVFRDAWAVDLAGSEAAVHQLAERLSGR